MGQFPLPTSAAAATGVPQKSVLGADALRKNILKTVV
jgi:hypothetical protein